MTEVGAGGYGGGGRGGSGVAVGIRDASGVPRVPGFAAVARRRLAQGGGQGAAQAGAARRARRARPGRRPPGRGGRRRGVQPSAGSPELTPIRVGRMAATPFAFLRGSAGLMAYDLARTPMTGIGAQICGDAHAANFGLYGDARGGLVIDLNDFDETVHGPWEWDLKRLAASLVLAGREAGADEDTCREAAHDSDGCLPAHHAAAGQAPALDAWNAIADEELVSHTDAHDLLGTLERVSEKARANTSGRFAAKSTEADRGRRAPLRRRAAGAAPGAGPGGGGGRGVAGAVPAPRSPRTGCRCSPGTRCTTWRSASWAPAAWARGRTSCCSWTTGASRWSSR